MKKILVTITSLMVLQGTLLAAPDQKKMPTPKVDVYEVEAPQELKIETTYPAIIKPYQEVNIISRVGGVLEKKYFNEGDFVKEGTSLYKIEDSLYKAKYEASLAQLAIANASLENAQKDWERNEKLYKSRSISDEKKDNSYFAYQSAKASVALAKANLSQAKIDLDYTTVKATIDGYSSLQNVDIGDYVSQNTKLLTLTQNEKLYVEFSIPSNDYTKLKNNLWTTSNNEKISLNILINGADVNVKGEVDFIDTNVDKTTSTVKMRATIDNKDGKLSSGSFVRVKFNNLIQKNVVLIPQKALLQSAQGTIVFIARDGKAEVRPVMIGDEVGDKYTLTWSKLATGDKVIVNNFFRAKPMQAVSVDKIINKQEETK